MNKFFKITLFALILLGVPVVWACDADDDWEDYPSSVPADDPVQQAMYGDNTGSTFVSDLGGDISSIVSVDLTKKRGQGTGKSGGEYQYLNNEDSTMENRNKLRLNAASQAISLGQRAVALATKSGEDVNALHSEIEKRDDILRMLKGIAKLQAQHLQKTNAITAMRAKLAEVNAIEDIMTLSLYTTNESTASK